MNNGFKVNFGTLATLATLALAVSLDAAMAADSSGAPTPAAGHHWHGAGAHRGSEAGLFKVLHQLNLSEAQKQELHSIMSTSRSQWQAQSGSALADLPALGNPGDPNHAAALQAAQTRAAQRLQQWDGVEQQVYSILTPAQQAQLPALLAQLQNELAARRSARSAG